MSMSAGSFNLLAASAIAASAVAPTPSTRAPSITLYCMFFLHTHVAAWVCGVLQRVTNAVLRWRYVITGLGPNRCRDTAHHCQRRVGGRRKFAPQSAAVNLPMGKVTHQRVTGCARLTTTVTAVKAMLHMCSILTAILSMSA